MTVGTGTAAPPPQASSTTGSSRLRQKRLTILLFLLPPLALYLLFVLLPMLRAIQFSLYDWNGLTPLTDFVGLDNYERAFNDTTFRNAVWHNFVIVVLSLAIQIPFALGLAIMLNQKLRGRWVYRLIFFAPYVIAEVAVALIWQQMLRTGGVATDVLEAVGLSGVITPGLGNPDTILYVVFFVVSWKFFGFHMIILLAGLQSIPGDLHEAAAIDGAGRFSVTRHITIPLLAPTIRISVFLSIIGAIQLFDLVWVMTTGGPLHASETMAIYMFDWGFIRFQFGYGSAVAVMMFGIALVVALLYQRFVLARDTEGAVAAQGA